MSGGNKSVYASNAEYELDKEYIATNNFAYNRKETTGEHLKTLGKFGEKIELLKLKDEPNIVKKIIKGVANGFLFMRNGLAAVYRAIGKPVSAIYKKLAKQKAGIYSNKRTHRYEARKDYFIKKENERLTADGKKLRPFRILMKARWQAITKYQEGNRAVLEAGYQDIKDSYIEKAKQAYFSDKLNALEDHIQFLENEKNRCFSDYMDDETQEKFNQIENALQDAIGQKDDIINNPKLQNMIKNGRIDSERKSIVQTDAVSLNQHDKANKANVTRTITGVKILTGAAIRFTGPKIEKWILNHSKIKEVQKLPDKIDRKWVEEVVPNPTPKVPSDTTTDVIQEVASKQELTKSFSLKNLMKLDKNIQVSYGYGEVGDLANNANLKFIRGVAQEIDGRVVSISDGNGFDISGITTGKIPDELLNNGTLADDANLFDVLAALQRQAGKQVTSQELIEKVAKCGSSQKQAEMIKKMTEGLNFWKSTEESGIATGWSSSGDGILGAIRQVKKTVKSASSGQNTNVIGEAASNISTSQPDVVTSGHWEFTKIPGGTKTVWKNNPRIVKALGLGEKIVGGVAIVDAISMFFENIRDTKSTQKPNKKEPRNYMSKQSAGFTGKGKKEDKQIDTSELKEEIVQEIENLER